MRDDGLLGTPEGYYFNQLNRHGKKNLPIVGGTIPLARILNYITGGSKLRTIFILDFLNVVFLLP